MPPLDPGDVQIVHVPLEELNEFEGNPRQRTAKVLDHLRKSIREFGLVDPVIVWANAGEFGCPPNTILGGHRRLDAYRSLIENGEVEPGPVPCVPVAVESVEKAKALNVALNKIGEEFDLPALTDWLAEIGEVDLDVELTGFDTEEVEKLCGDFEPIDDQARLDKLSTERSTCPKCGYEFTRR
ncbi:MAG: ParB N-terminal domain-containing protein [Candidatus Zixiibacteriota bacterium]|jgi:ParB-like chromosome segregation protein Spo0J